MRQLVRGLLLLAVLLSLVLPASAADDATAIVDKALKAHFPKGVDTKNQGVHMRSKGTLHVQGLDLDYSQEVYIQLPDKFKEVMELTVQGNKVTITTVYNGKQAWIKAVDNDVKVTDEIMKELKEAAHGMNVVLALHLKDKDLKLALTGETKVKDKPAVGVTVSKKGFRDINLFFDKETGLIAKVESRKLDIQNNQEVTEERIITAYQEVDGRKVAKSVEVLRDGKAFIEAEVTEVKFPEKVDDAEFAEPK